MQTRSQSLLSDMYYDVQVTSVEIGREKNSKFLLLTKNGELGMEGLKNG